MRSAARTVAVAASAMTVVVIAWLRVEQPMAPLWRVLALAVLAVAAAAPRRRSLRLVASAAAIVAAAWIAMGVSFVPSGFDAGSGFGLSGSFSAVSTRFGNGFSDFYVIHLPFDPRVHGAMGELVLAAIFTFSLAIALLARARRPVASALALLLGAGWPATLLGPAHGIAMGAAILVATLVVFAGLGSRRIPAFTLPAAVAIATAAVAVGSATAARHGLVHWQSWNPTGAEVGGSVSVGFVWNARYGGLDWPAHPTVVLQVQAQEEPSFLRAAILDDFQGDAWMVGPARPADALEPAAALLRRNETRQIVTVEGLADNRLVGQSVPIHFDDGGVPLVEPERGAAALHEELPRGFQYTAWSYVARPTAAELRHSGAEYPSELRVEGLLDVGRGVTLPPFGALHRVTAVQTLLTRNPALSPYVPLARLAEEVAGRARTPYDAVARLEDWFAFSGAFHYSDHPLVIGPPLVGFVTKTRAGYCQYFAGAMALMLRYLGIPARVAVGFAGGTYDTHRHVWIVTDREAHAWVEVWFKGYGWLPFDPTPVVPGAAPRPTPVDADLTSGGGGPEPGFFGRGGAGAIGVGSPTVANALSGKNGFILPDALTPSAQAASTGRGGADDRSRPALLLLLALIAAVTCIALTKVGFRVGRSSRRDPRRVAAACREELAAFLLDQRIEVPRSATLYELGEHVQRDFGVNAEPFVAAATIARFGRPADGVAAARAARRELRVLLDGVRRSLTRRERLRGLLSLRSLARPAAAVAASASLGSGMLGSAGS